MMYFVMQLVEKFLVKPQRLNGVTAVSYTHLPEAALSAETEAAARRRLMRAESAIAPR